jgi:hypothetical protein
MFSGFGDRLLVIQIELQKMSSRVGQRRDSLSSKIGIPGCQQDRQGGTLSKKLFRDREANTLVCTSNESHFLEPCVRSWKQEDGEGTHLLLHMTKSLYFFCDARV